MTNLLNQGQGLLCGQQRAFRSTGRGFDARDRISWLLCFSVLNKHFFAKEIDLVIKILSVNARLKGALRPRLMNLLSHPTFHRLRTFNG